MKKLQKILMALVLVSILVGILAVGASAAEMTPVKVMGTATGDESASATSSSGQKAEVATASKSSGDKYYQMKFIDKTSYVTLASSGHNFLGQGEYIVMEYDFMAEDWTKVKNIGLEWNTRSSSNKSLSDFKISFSNSDGKPKLTAERTGGGTITLESKPGVWHHITIVAQLGGEFQKNSNGTLSAVKGQDAVEVYMYVDGQLFAKNLSGDGRDYLATGDNLDNHGSCRYSDVRITAHAADQQFCIDNMRVLQYASSQEFRSFFKYRQNNNGQFPNIDAVAYPFLDYNADYAYPLGNATLKVVELNGNEMLFDRFDKASKRAASISGAKIVLLADVDGVEVKYPVTVDLAGYKLDYTVVPSLRVDEEERVNPITGERVTSVSFVKKTKYAYFSWEINHLGETDSRGYTPLAVGTSVVYDGTEFPNQYFLDGKLYGFTGEWLLDDQVLSEVPTYAANSYYRLSPRLEVKDVYAILTTAEGVVYVTDANDIAKTLENAPAGSVLSLVCDVELSSALTFKKGVTLDLAGKKLTLDVENGASAILLEEGAAGSEIKSSAPGGAIVTNGVLFESACAFTVKGENLVAEANALLKTDVALTGVKIRGGVFVLIGAKAFILGDEASLAADVRAALIAGAADVALIDAAAAYEITLGGVIYGIALPASDVSELILVEGLALNGVSAALGAELPAGIVLADEALVIAAKKQTATYGAVEAETAFIVADKANAALIKWDETVSEYFVTGETIYHLYSDFYDATKFYTPNGSYKFLLEGGSVIGNEILAEYAGLEIAVEPCFDSHKFYVVAAKPDGSFVHYATAINLSVLLSSDEFEAGTVFALGRDNLLLKNAEIAGDYAIDLNGHALLVEGTSCVKGALRIFSTLEGASFYSGATQAFLLEGGALEIDGVLYAGGTLADLDAESSLAIVNGAFFIEEGAFFRAADGAEIAIEALSANAELFAAAAGYAWTAADEQIVVGGQAFTVAAKYAKIAE